MIQSQIVCSPQHSKPLRCIYSPYSPGAGTLQYNTINNGLKRLQKYYSHFDRKPAYLLTLALYPYYKLADIKLAWGVAEEQEEDWAAGNIDVKNWQDEVWKILEFTMQEYWNS